MTARVNVTAANAALAKVAQQGLLHVDFDVVQQAALAVWHTHEEVNLESVQGPYLGEAVRLLERLSFYNVVNQDRKKALLSQVRRFEGMAQVTVKAPEFETAYRKFLPRLQPLQTRHFAAA
jgi:hypothetical protein